MLESSLERRKTVYTSLLKVAGIFEKKGEIKGPVKRNAAANLEWLIQHGCVSCVGTQDDTFDLLSLVSRSYIVTKSDKHTIAYISNNLKCIISFEFTNKNLAYFSILCSCVPSIV